MNPVILRALIYIGLAMLPEFMAFFDDLTERGAEVQVHWAVWTGLCLQAAYQALLVMRAFVDGTNERHKQAVQTQK